MEKTCEFCKEFRPVVYCNADAAYLCLLCDARVHSANALSNRHLRSLLCDLCRYRPAHVRCLDHRMFACCVCEKTLHGVSSQHQRQVVSSYMGCPSARDFATLCGFELDKVDKSAVQDQLHMSYVSLQPSLGNFDFPREFRSQTRGSSVALQTPYEGQHQQNTCFILQQILDLKRLQLTEVINTSPLVHGPDEMDASSSLINPLKKLDGKLDDLQHSDDQSVDLRQNQCLLQELNSDSLNLPFSQPDNLLFSSTAANALLGESFWECRSSVQSSQLWSQNMQDLGVCEDVVCHDDLNIPDVDLTFRNFEELFGVEQDHMRALLDDKNMSCSSVDKDMSVDQSVNRNARTREDTSVASSVRNSASIHQETDNGPNLIRNVCGESDAPQTIRPCHSAMSFSVSRQSAERISTEYLDSGVSSRISAGGEDFGDHSEARENATTRYREKKKTKGHETQTRDVPRKDGSDDEEASERPVCEDSRRL